MAQDIIKPTGTLKSSKPDVGGANTKNFPVFGIVKDNIDPTRAGRIKVLLGDKGPKDPDDSSSWVSVSYLSNFFGKVDSTAAGDGHGTYKSNPSSYGEWHAPPDIGTKVICIFVNGDSNYGFYVGCVPEAESLHMVPAIGSSDNIVANEGEAASYGGAVRLPVTNINTNNADTANSPTFNDAPRPVHSYSAAIMNQQGIIRDPIRGPISSSASREASSRVGWGVSTPGRPIYEGGFDDSTVAKNLDSSKNKQLKVVARRGGHSLVMDDGDIIGRDQLIRLRTALGHQILMSDDGQTLMILHSNGQSYIELGKEGTIDMYATNSVNIRTHGDLNLHADRNININAAENLNIQAKTIHTNSEEATQLRSGKDIKFSAAGKLTGLAAGPIAWAAGGDASLVAGGQSYVNGSKVNLNSGAPGTTPEAVPNIPLVAQTDTLYDKEKGFMASPGKLLTIASRAPAHAPWANAGQGVDVKVDLGASSQLPPAPASAVSAATTAGAATSPKPPAVATVASAPSVSPVSKAMDKNTTSAVMGSIATTAATGPLAPATKQGTAIVNTAGGKVAAVGSFAQTATQLATGGVLKPGAATLVDGLVQQGKTIAAAMPTSVFAGVPGAQNLSSLVKNTTAQATSVVNNLQQAQSALGQAGMLTGKEAPTIVAGMVTAVATVGLPSTIAAVQQVSGVVTQSTGALTKLATGALADAATGAINSAVGGAVSQFTGAIGQVQGAAVNISGALTSIGQGGVSAALATSVTGGLGGIANALTAMGTVPSLAGLMDQAKGVAGSAFAAIKNSFKPFVAGVPQNLTTIAKENAAAAAAVADQAAGAATDLLSTAKGALGSAATLGGAVGAATGALSKVQGVVAGSLSSLSTAAGALKGATSAINGPGLSSLTSAAGSINNSVAGITGELTSAAKGISDITSSLSSVATTVTTTVNGVTAVSSSFSGSIKSAINTTIGGVEHATNTVSAIAGAGATISQGGIAALSNAAASIQAGASASVSSIMASGLSNLPGGVNTAASVMNNAIGAINKIPGTASLTGLIKDAQSSAMNGLSSKLTGALGDIQGKLGGLTALASAGLPVGAVAQLQSSIASLSSGSPATISLPTLGFNTNNREEIAAQTNSVIGDPAIPSPNLTGSVDAEVVQEYQTQSDELKEKIAAAKAKADISYDAYRKAEVQFNGTMKDEYLKAENEYPRGDPIVEALDKKRTAYYVDVYKPAKAKFEQDESDWRKLL